MRNLKVIAVIILTMLCHALLCAQERFDLQKRNGHYYFTATLNDIPAECMLESGIPAMLVGEKHFRSCLESSGLSFEPSKGKMRLFNQLYDILFRADGEVRIGNALYDGPVFILKDYSGISVPVQYLKDPATRQAVMTIDLKNNYIRIGTPKNRVYGKKYRLSSDKDLGFPIVAAKVCLQTPEGRSRLKGNLIVDFGNPSLLFLLKQHKSMAKAIKAKTIGLKDAYDKQGRLVAQGLYADTVSMFGQKFLSQSIGVTDKMNSIEHLGFLGTPFFTSPVMFDFDRGFMIL